ncbi:TRAP-type C4-dicarboxylate transport system, substrate-binding protein [Palleronia marisminoris]|uniref:2,3-diketo-L-gulonate-binding periplasmic protein YiaO n=1 Tax=Palleronia marisminoris TaxID=315423 RepID=A0A1Y5SA42_9RHOB|nr:TRAP transporter substrate-binding protein [Palleronia marisminoris]SFG67682.1 TRAP-type C4-dicarboxylate transport system, substrate-binding protein [Palleronia marisminoris]SLN34417.1 2,3-diketo-L-gulonate-binding periplasmic protein YiaO precursor [Palleronia marisminoris]
MFTTTLKGAAALAVLATPALAQELKLAEFHPPTHFVVEEVYDPMDAALAEATNNELGLQLYMGGELGAGPAEQYNRVVEGVADISFGLPGYTASNFPKTLLTELPGVIDPDTGTEAIIENIDMLSDEYRRVQLLSLWNNEPAYLLTADTPIRSLEDMSGLSIRVPSRNAGLVIEAWGATPVSMPAPEIYNAMQTGVIDGAMIDPSALDGFKLNEVTNCITRGMDTTISSFFLIMNRDSFDNLSDEKQQALLEAGEQAARDGREAWAAAGDTAMETFRSTEGKEIIELSDEAAQAFDDASATVVDQVISEAEAQGLNAAEFVDALESSTNGS